MTSPGHFFTQENLLRSRRLLSTWKTGFAIKASQCRSMFQPFIPKQTMNTDFLIQLQYYTVLTDYTWTPFCLWKMLYQGPEYSSTSGKMVSQWWQFNFSGHVTGSHHKYTLSEPRPVAYSPDLLHQNTGLPTEYAVPRTTRLFKTWKTSIGMNISWYSGHFK